MILEGFSEYRHEFRLITAGAQVRFETADWKGIQVAAIKRIELYKRVIGQMVTKITPLVAAMPPDSWSEITDEVFKKVFKGSAVKRTKYVGLKRNLDFLK